MIWWIYTPNWLRRFYLKREISMLKSRPPDHLVPRWGDNQLRLAHRLVQWPSGLFSLLVFGLIWTIQFDNILLLPVTALIVGLVCLSAYAAVHFYSWARETERDLRPLSTASVHVVLQKRIAELDRLL